MTSELEKLAMRLNEIEAKFAFQEDTIQTLDDLLIQQTLEIQKLWEANKYLKGKLDEVHNNDQTNDGPPPHY